MALYQTRPITTEKPEWNYLGEFRDNYGVLFGIWYKENGGKELEFFILGDSENGELAEPLNLGKIELDESKHLLGATEKGNGKRKKILIEIGNNDVVESYVLNMDGNPHLHKMKSVRHYNDNRDELGGFYELTGHSPDEIEEPPPQIF